MAAPAIILVPDGTARAADLAAHGVAALAGDCRVSVVDSKAIVSTDADVVVAFALASARILRRRMKPGARLVFVLSCAPAMPEMMRIASPDDIIVGPDDAQAAIAGLLPWPVEWARVPVTGTAWRRLVRRALRIPSKPARVHSRKRKALLISDVHDWAFDVNLRDLAEYVAPRGWDFDFAYVAETSRPDGREHDANFTPFHRWQLDESLLPWERRLGSLRGWWFRAEDPRPPTDDDIALVNRHRAFHVVTKHNLDELAPHCPNVVYLTNPVNTRIFDGATPIEREVVASWTGNARHWHPHGHDVKGFHSIVKPACEAAGVPLVSAEYNTSRVPHREMPGFFARGNVTLCASLYEGASNSIMEAMAMGHAVISADAGNVREMMESQIEHLGETGILLVERTPAAFAAALRSLKRDPSWVRHMGRLNRTEIRSRWSWSVWADRYDSFMRSACP